MQFAYCPSCGQKGTVKKHNDTWYQCANCNWQHWNNAKGAVAIAFVKDGKVLVSKRANEPYKGQYDLPGGFIDYGEGAYEAAIREAAEELGVTLNKEDLMIADAYPHHYLIGEVSTIDIIFIARHWQGEFQAADDVASVQWESFSFVDKPNFAATYKGLSALLKNLPPSQLTK